ncbi:EboA domain-containing protein [Streptomyces sp. TRM66268-LWL]|uniref:EboA domain-containing protein n=1 Tax=Streptomyces polyasparticus TaxID=2767826 RepID=A0ABR7SE69_9ACTN|nr:EboA domain-containing protein [Streptomyces polyasparticus]MBC9713479.1 EboA domain-containing protein [Streptomyces polyasparticus]
MTRTPSLAALRAGLETALDPDARAWLDQSLTEAADHKADSGQGPVPTWELRFAQAGRRCGPEHADDARLLLLHAARADTATLTRLYEQGTAAERRAVLRTLDHLVPGPEALGLTEDALRTNDTSLVAAAVGPYGAEHLGAHAWRHAVLKCLFTGVSVDEVAALADRARGDAELARMLGDFARERTAAGRPVPADLQRVLALTEVSAETSAETCTETSVETSAVEAPGASSTEPLTRAGAPTEPPSEAAPAASAASPQES